MNDFKKELHIVQSDYHGSDWEGNQLKLIMKKENLDKLEDCIPSQFAPFVDCLRNLDNVYTSCTGSVLDPYHEQVIDKFSDSFDILHKQFGVTITPKVHIIQDHLADFFKQSP